MILVRDVFQLHFGKAKEATALAREGAEIEKRHNNGRPFRILTDMTGEYYTLVFESQYDGLGDLEDMLQKSFQDPQWKEWYARFSPLARSGRREIFRIVE